MSGGHDSDGFETLSPIVGQDDAAHIDRTIAEEPPVPTQEQDVPDVQEGYDAEGEDSSEEEDPSEDEDEDPTEDPDDDDEGDYAPTAPVAVQAAVTVGLTSDGAGPSFRHPRFRYTTRKTVAPGRRLIIRGPAPPRRTPTPSLPPSPPQQLESSGPEEPPQTRRRIGGSPSLPPIPSGSFPPLSFTEHALHGRVLSLERQLEERTLELNQEGALRRDLSTAFLAWRNAAYRIAGLHSRSHSEVTEMHSYFARDEEGQVNEIVEFIRFAASLISEDARNESDQLLAAARAQSPAGM